MTPSLDTVCRVRGVTLGYDTSVTWTCTPLISASTLLLVLRHFCYVGRHVSDRCFGTPASATVLLLRGQTSLFNIIPCLHVLIVLCPSHSVLEVYAGKYLYVVYPNNKIHEIK